MSHNHQSFGHHDLPKDLVRECFQIATNYLHATTLHAQLCENKKGVPRGNSLWQSPNYAIIKLNVDASVDLGARVFAIV